MMIEPAVNSEYANQTPQIPPLKVKKTFTDLRYRQFPSLTAGYNFGLPSRKAIAVKFPDLRFAHG